MQVVFVHGVNTRDDGDGQYAKWVEDRDDRFKRLLFGSAATIHNPYWGKFGRPNKVLTSLPVDAGTTQALGTTRALPAQPNIPAMARENFVELVASLSVAAIGAAAGKPTEERRRIEDFWMKAAAYADERVTPGWAKSLTGDQEFASNLNAEVAAGTKTLSLGSTLLPGLRSFDLNVIAAGHARQWTSGFLAQFLGDALMFFARRDTGIEVRKEISQSIATAANAASRNGSSLVVIGHSMGGSLIHDILSDREEVDRIEQLSGQPLRIDLFLSVGTQIGLFKELGLFGSNDGPFGLIPTVHRYWNVYDYTDTLAFRCEPLVQGVQDFEVNTAAGIQRSHNAYFENALFFNRLRRRLIDSGLVA